MAEMKKFEKDLFKRIKNVTLRMVLANLKENINIRAPKET